MADPSSYRQRWKLNTQLADICVASLPGGGDWEIVFRFYAAVHLVEGYLRTKDPAFWAENHEQRRRRFAEAPEMKSAKAPYVNLEDLSKQVRYDPAYVAPAKAFVDAKAWATKVESVLGTKLEAKLKSAPGPV